MKVKLAGDIKEFYLLALKFNNHKDIHVVQRQGAFMQTKQDARSFGMEIMDNHLVLIYQKADGAPYKAIMPQLEAIKQKYKYLEPTGFEIYMDRKGAGETAMGADMLCKGK